jgi:hypothetical protein
MAKKARKKLEEAEEARSFEFPEFDETKFIEHEKEQTTATAVALGLAVLLGVVSFLIDRFAGTAGVVVYIPLGVGLLTVASSPFLFLRLRAAAEEYTKGDWATLILLQVFGWLGIWFLLTDVFLGR